MRGRMHVQWNKYKYRASAASAWQAGSRTHIFSETMDFFRAETGFSCFFFE